MPTSARQFTVTVSGNRGPMWALAPTVYGVMKFVGANCVRPKKPPYENGRTQFAPTNKTGNRFTFFPQRFRRNAGGAEPRPYAHNLPGKL